MPTGAIAGASIVGGGLGALGAKSAAKTQAGAARDAAAMQMDMFNTIRGDLAPYREYGAGALPALSKLLGFGGGQEGQPDWGSYLSSNPDAAAWVQGKMASEGGSADQWAQQHYALDGSKRAIPTYAADNGSGVQSALEALPGYQFARDQGMKAVTNSLSARGLGGGSGAFGKGLARFVTGLADSTYGSQVDRLTGAANIGSNAASQTGSFGTTAAANAGGNLVGAGNAGAAGTLGATGAISGGLQGAANSLLMNKILGMYGPKGGGGGSSGGGFNLGWGS